MKKEEFQQNMKDRMQQFEDGGLRLLKKGQKGIVHAIFSRFGLVLLLMLLQVGVLWSVFRWFGGLLPHYFGGSVAMSAFMVVYILNSEMDNSAKITWMVTIAILPVVGVPLFFYVKSNIGHNALKKRVTHLTEEARGLQPQPLAAAQELAEADPGAASLARYLHGKGGGFSVYRNTEVTYFPGGEAKFEELLRQLEKAEKYIFLEYFIIDEGLMWGKILEVLARKAAEGVDVRVMYDGTCEFTTLPRDYPSRLEKLGIQCRVFSPVQPFVSTHYNYRDHRKILVIDGKVGFTLAEHLSQEEHDITVIDTNDAALRHASEALDVMCVKGNGASISALRESGVDAADVLIAATSMDEVNMVCCLTAKRLGAKYTIARVRNVEYAMELSLLKEALGIDLVINPENAAAAEIARLLRFPPAANLETFCRGRVELIGFRVREEDFLVGHPLSAQSGQLQSLPMLFCAAERAEGDVVIPDGSFVPQVGDRLYLIGQPTGLTAFFRLLGRHNPRCRNVFLVGGGRIAHYLTAILERLGIHVKIIERSLDRCRHLSEVLPKATVICGDGTDQELLEEEDVTASDAFVALTDRDEDNLIISLYAMQQGIPKVVAKSNRQNYAGIAHAAGLDSVISPKLLTAGQILQVVRGMQNSKGSVMNALYKIADGHAEAMEFVANATTRNRDTPLRELRLKPGILVAVLVHQGRIVIPDGSSSIAAGDTVIVISRNHGILDLNDIFEDSLLELGGDA